MAKRVVGRSAAVPGGCAAGVLTRRACRNKLLGHLLAAASAANRRQQLYCSRSHRRREVPGAAFLHRKSHLCKTGIPAYSVELPDFDPSTSEREHVPSLRDSYTNSLYPALTCRAIECRPFGAGILTTLSHCSHKSRVLTHTLDAAPFQNKILGGAGLVFGGGTHERPDNPGPPDSRGGCPHTSR